MNETLQLADFLVDIGTNRQQKRTNRFSEVLPEICFLEPLPGAFSSHLSPKYGLKHTPGARYNKDRDRAYTMMVKCTIRHKKIRRISFCPGLINDLAEPRLLSQGEPEFQDVVAYMQKWCKELGTELEVEGDEVVVLPHEQGL